MRTRIGERADVASARRSSVLAVGAVLAGVMMAVAVSADDWPQWRGADRLAVWHETGIVEDLPEELKVAWRTPIRSGYSGPAVAGGRVFITDWREDPESRTLDGAERMLALDEETGEVLWTHEWPTSYRMLSISYAVGPRSTPTVDGDRVYVVGATGRLFCFDVETGAVRWQKDYVAEYGTSVPVWGIVSAPLVDGDRLLTVVGGEPDALVVAFDKHTGEELWRAIEVEAEMGYAQPVIYEAGGARQLIVWHPRALASLDPETGELYWEQPWDVSMGITVATPVRSGNYLLVSQFFNGSLMMQLSQDRPDATELWRGRSRSELPGETDTIHSMVDDPDHHRRPRLRRGQLRRAARARRRTRRAAMDEPGHDRPGAVEHRLPGAARRPLLRQQRRGVPDARPGSRRKGTSSSTARGSSSRPAARAPARRTAASPSGSSTGPTRPTRTGTSSTATTGRSFARRCVRPTTGRPIRRTSRMPERLLARLRDRGSCHGFLEQLG